MVQATKHTLRVSPGKKPTPEEIKEQQVRALIQKRESFAQGILYNLAGNPSAFSTIIAEPETIAKAAVRLAEATIESLYGAKLSEAAGEDK